MEPTPRFVQAIRNFEGSGLDEYEAFDPPLSYEVPEDVTAQCVEFRAGNSSEHLVCVVLTRDGEPMRLFPIGARDAIHVPLRITESLPSDTLVELHIAAPLGATGTVVVDLEILEV